MVSRHWDRFWYQSDGTEDEPTKTTSDGSFTYGSVDVYVWFDGTDYSCT